MLFEFEFVVDFLVAKRAASLQLMRAFLIVFLLLFEMDNFEAVVTVFKVMLLVALLDVVLEELRNLNVLLAVVAGRNKLTLLGQVEVKKVFIFKTFAL